MNDEIKLIAAENMIKEHLTLGVFQHQMMQIGVHVVLPGDTTSLVYLSDHSRYFVEVNDDDVVVGGYFG